MSQRDECVLQEQQNVVPAPAKQRAAWQPLGFEKIEFVETQSGAASTPDGGGYS